MTHFLVSDEKPDGYKLEDLLSILRRDIVRRSAKIMEDEREEAQQVLDNNVRILTLLSECIHLSKDSTRMLEKSFGPSIKGKPRIGKP